MTIAYTTGTINLVNGSTAVVGAGTAWQTALIVGGLLVPQSATGNALVIDTVTDNTHMVAAKPWTGPTGSYSYALIRDTAYLKQIAQNATALSQILDEIRAGTLFKYDVAAPISQRPTYDGQPAGFAFLATDSVPFTLYIKNSNANGDWSVGARYAQGERGPPPTLAVGAVTTGAPGTAASVATSGSGTSVDPYQMNFTIPSGLTGLVHRGDWSSTVTYSIRDAVQYQGSTWMCKQLTLEVAPPNLPTTSTAWWQLVAIKGTDGTGIGDMVKTAYDPQNLQADAFANENQRYLGRNATHIVEGDSLGAGYLLANPSVESWFARYLAMGGYARGYLQSFNVAVSGSTIVDMANRYNALVKPHRPTPNGGDGGPRSFLYLNGGTNPLAQNQTAAQILTSLTNYITTAKNDGFIVVLGTVSSSKYLTNGQEEQRLILNAAIRRGSAGANIVWDMDSIITNPYDPDICPDGGHYSAAACIMLANYLDNGMKLGRFSIEASRGFTKFGSTVSDCFETVGIFTVNAQPSLIVKDLGIYKRLWLEGDLYPSASYQILMNLSVDNGNTWDSSNNYQHQLFNFAAGTTAPFSNVETSWPLSAKNTVGPNTLNGLGFDMTIDNFNVPRRERCRINLELESSIYAASTGGFRHLAAVAHNAFQILPAGGTISGDLLVRGSRF